MAEVISTTGERQEEINLPENIFNQKSNPGLIWEAIRNHLANQREGNAKTKSKGEVSGGGKKPWRQKHTGRARHGSIRSPIWVGGGVVFGPSPRDYSVQMPKKKKQKALLVALSDKMKTSALKVISDLTLETNKTKEMAKVLSGLGLKETRTLILLDSISEDLKHAARNIPNLNLKRAKDLNIYDVVGAEKIIFSKNGIEQFIANYSNKSGKTEVTND
ncbi:MAG: 50S ribosomal protein L4 [candidate division WOR-3 bacterium]|nr:50S ribosomal protein L4 [candidate division WOR-3 bacterium]MDH5683517.1 50S ribosomal protein L4 [candidate division WOR-3 bacterium]